MFYGKLNRTTSCTRADSIDAAEQLVLRATPEVSKDLVGAELNTRQFGNAHIHEIKNIDADSQSIHSVRRAQPRHYVRPGLAVHRETRDTSALRDAFIGRPRAA